eukprot:18792-Heterococcus_DN1.PRE.7
MAAASFRGQPLQSDAGTDSSTIGGQHRGIIVADAVVRRYNIITPCVCRFVCRTTPYVHAQCVQLLAVLCTSSSLLLHELLQVLDVT